ncbi:unnamed protein product, partial [Aphanomyces euteiches]
MALSFMGNSVVEGLGDCVVDLANPMDPLELDILQLQQEIGISVKQDTQVEVKTASCQGDLVVKPSKEKDAKSSTSTAQQEREPEPTTPS